MLKVESLGGGGKGFIAEKEGKRCRGRREEGAEKRRRPKAAPTPTSTRLWSGLSHGEEGGFVLVGEMGDVAGAVAGYVHGVACGEEFVVALAQEFVSEFQGAVFRFEDGGADCEEFVVTC